MINQIEKPLQLCCSYVVPYQQSFGESPLLKSLSVPNRKHYPARSQKFKGIDNILLLNQLVKLEKKMVSFQFIFPSKVFFWLIQVI